MSISMLSPGEAANLVAQGKARLLDVRTTAEFATVRIEGADLVPSGALTREGVQPAAGTTLVLFCASGRRSLNAAQKLAEAMPEVPLASLDGGIKAWEKQGLPVLRNPKRLSLERQVQVAAGSMIALGTLLAAYVSPAFLVIPGFVGCGLVFAGLTGTCGLARVLTLAPWNTGAVCDMQGKSCTR